jgi:hypothetical protein
MMRLSKLCLCFAIGYASVMLLSYAAKADEPSTVEAVEKAATAVTKATETGTDLVARVADALEKAATTYGPRALELTLESARIIAVQNLVSNGLFALLFITVIICYFKYVLWASGEIKGLEEHDSGVHSWRDRKSEEPHFVGPTVGGIATAFSCLFLMFAMNDLIQVRSWVGIWHPELYISTGIVKKYVD